MAGRVRVPVLVRRARTEFPKDACPDVEGGILFPRGYSFHM